MCFDICTDYLVIKSSFTSHAYFLWCKQFKYLLAILKCKLHHY